jgi:hypothetical protein
MPSPAVVEQLDTLVASNPRLKRAFAAQRKTSSA